MNSLSQARLLLWFDLCVLSHPLPLSLYSNSPPSTSRYESLFQYELSSSVFLPHLPTLF